MTAQVSLYNTLTRRVDPLQPVAPPRVTLYTCGPTVWNYAHIGNFRTFLFEDLLRRWLEQAGYDVFHIMNLTDVDDRTIKAARAAGRQLTEHTAPFTKAFFEDRDYLRIKPAHIYPAATEYMPQMIALVSKLLERGFAYKGEDGSVYFAIAQFPSYGRLSQLDPPGICANRASMPPRCGCCFSRRTIASRSISPTKPWRRRGRACAGSASSMRASRETGNGKRETPRSAS